MVAYPLICLNSPNLHCWPSSHPLYKNVGTLFSCVCSLFARTWNRYSMPRACRRELDALKYLILFVMFLGRELISYKLSERCAWLFHTCKTRKRVPLSSPGHPATKKMLLHGSRMPNMPRNQGPRKPGVKLKLCGVGTCCAKVGEVIWDTKREIWRTLVAESVGGGIILHDSTWFLYPPNY